MVIGDWELEAKYYGKQPTKGVATHMHVHTSQMSGIIIFFTVFKILISSFAHKMDFAHNISVDFF